MTGQAERFRDFTEALFRAAGLREGWRLLDLGSGVGDVAMLTAFDRLLPDPVGTLRSVARLVRPRGIVAIQEVAWTPARAASSHLALWSACASVVHEAIRRAGARTDPGLTLHRVFQQAGLPAPTMTFDMKIGSLRELILWVYDLLRSVRPGMQPDQNINEPGDLDTLADRLVAEVAAAQSAVTSVAVIGAWSQVSADR